MDRAQPAPAAPPPLRTVLRPVTTCGRSARRRDTCRRPTREAAARHRPTVQGAGSQPASPGFAPRRRSCPGRTHGRSRRGHQASPTRAVGRARQGTRNSCHELAGVHALVRAHLIQPGGPHLAVPLEVVLDGPAPLDAELRSWAEKRVVRVGRPLVRGHARTCQEQPHGVALVLQPVQDRREGIAARLQQAGVVGQRR